MQNSNMAINANDWSVDRQDERDINREKIFEKLPLASICSLMNIDRLRYFATVVETKNLRKAAELVHIAPASMSKAISTLGDDLGLELLRPEGRGIEITEQGMDVYRASLGLLEEYRRFQEQMALSKNAPSKPKLRISSFEVFSSSFLSSFFAELIPDEEVLLLEQEPGEIEDAILDDVVEFGITYIPKANERLEFTEIGRFQMRIFGHPKWNEVPFEEWPFAIPITRLSIYAQEYQSLDLWPELPLKRFIKYQFELLETALSTSAIGLSVLHCPTFVVSLHNRLVKTEFHLEELTPPASYKAPPAISIYLVAKKGNTRTADLERKLAKLLRSLK